MKKVDYKPRGSRLPFQLYTAAQVRDMERVAIEVKGVPGIDLMNCAGEVAYRSLRRRWPSARRFAVVCGGGNNAGDGYVIARLALEDGMVKPVVLNAGDPNGLRGHALEAAKAYRDKGGKEQSFVEGSLNGADVVVDALLGIGLNKPLVGVYAEAVAAMNKGDAPVLSIDVPTGLNADSGMIMGSAVQADVTVSFIGLKRGMLTASGPDCCGQIEFDSLGVPASVAEGHDSRVQRIDAGIVRALFKPRCRSAHKGSYGHVLVVGGDYGFAGAARMVGEAAARSGAGLVSVATRPEHLNVVLAGRPELMCRGVETAEDLRALRGWASVIAIGSGLGTKSWGRFLWESVRDAKQPMVVDADALNMLAEQPMKQDSWVLTPHPGEAARLLKVTSEDIQADRFAAVKAIQSQYGGVVLLKGAGSLVVDGKEFMGVCDAGNPGMASGGMGDVLCGVIAGFLAQGASPVQAARAGAYLHGAAADRAAEESGERGMLASDLLPHLRRLINP